MKISRLGWREYFDDLYNGSKVDVTRDIFVFFEDRNKEDGIPTEVCRCLRRMVLSCELIQQHLEGKQNTTKWKEEHLGTNL